MPSPRHAVVDLVVIADKFCGKPLGSLTHADLVDRTKAVWAATAGSHREDAGRRDNAGAGAHAAALVAKRGRRRFLACSRGVAHRQLPGS